MIKAIIIDDEPHCVSALQHDIALFCSGVTIVDTSSSGREGILSIEKNKPDLVFLDVEMPLMNGFQMLEALGHTINFQLIFTTAYDNFAARAFRMSAVDYLLKPIDSNDLVEAVAKAKLNLRNNASKQIGNLKYNFNHSVNEQKIALPNRDGYDFVNVKEIQYCQADGAYTKIMLNNAKTMLLSKPLGELTEMLPGEMFERIHHSSLVNVRYIKQFIKRDGTYLVMENGAELPVSKSKKDNLLIRLGLAKP